MQMDLTLIAIAQNKRAVVQFSEVDEKGNPKDDCLVSVNFKDPKEAEKFSHGSVYTISFTQKITT